MPRRDERDLAAHLARVLDGEEAGHGEARELAALLERAAEPARFVVETEEVERALRRVRPRLAMGAAQPAPRPRLRFALAGVAALAVTAIAVLTLTRTTGVPVEERALAALGTRGSVVRIVQRIEPAAVGAFGGSVRSGWIDSVGERARWDQFVERRLVTSTLVERGRVSRYILADNVVIVGSSCRAFASGCAEATDPIAFYRTVLARRGVASVRRTRAAGRTVYELILPVQSLPDAVRIEQRVLVDAKTYLPVRIEWRDHPPGREARTVTVITVTRIRRFAASRVPNAFELRVPWNVRVVQRAGVDRPLRKLAERRLTLAQARAVRPRLRWLGPDYRGFMPLRRVTEVRWNAGRAFLFEYEGGLRLWNYDRVIPPELLSDRFGFAKTIPIGNRVARFYESRRGFFVGELEGVPWSVALVAPQFGKIDVIGALRDLRELR